MKSFKAIGGLALAALAAASGAADAALAGPVTIKFTTMPEAVFGRASVAPASSGACPLWLGSGCYIESNVVFGTVNDTTPFVGAGGHIHSGAYGATKPANKGLQYDADSAGVFIRMKDSSAFSLKSMYFYAPKNADNPDTGTQDYWTIYGFGKAAYPAATTDKILLNVVATYTVKNGFAGTITLPAGFNNVKSVWIHYNGYPKVPTDPDLVLDKTTGEVISDGPKQAKLFSVIIDNVVLSAPVGAVCP